MIKSTVIDFLTKKEIDPCESMMFISKINDVGDFEIGYVQSFTDEFMLQFSRYTIFTDKNEYLLYDDSNLDSLFAFKSCYSIGKYKKSFILHNTIKKLFDRPSSYKKFYNIKQSKSYSSTIEKIKYNQKYGIETSTSIILENNHYTFGVEIETAHGRIENYGDLNLSCVYDGSLKDDEGVCFGGEYVTGVLVGDQGVFHLKKIVDKLVDSDCGINSKCSVHIHIGNINWNRERIVYAWALGCILEEEIFSMLPFSRRNNVFCKKLSSKLDLKLDYNNISKFTKLEYEEYIEIYYNAIFQIVTSNNYNMPNKNIHKRLNHPDGPKQRYDHNAQRYCWLNFVPMMFDTRDNNSSRTIEFRPHSGTLNYKKIENWLKICMAFVKTVDSNIIDIKNGKVNTISDILRIAFPISGQKVSEYVEFRKKIFNSISDVDTIMENSEYDEINKIEFKSIKQLVCV